MTHLMLISLSLIIALTAFGLQRYIAARTAWRRLPLVLFLGLIIALTITTTILLFNPAAAYAERAQLAPFVVAVYGVGAVVVVLLGALLSGALLTVMRCGDLRRVSRYGGAFWRALANGQRHPPRVSLGNRHRFAGINDSSFDQSPEQGSAYDPLDKWMNPHHPANPILHEMMDD